ncbi:MAG: AAA family ATPase, partial [Acidobacteriota bacterium]|nr:AAA family ATPase [Acidobacteriota bacterium]
MHITKIELEDIKSHQNAKFEFERGTTAITGENGAGKTTIIEAVAWTLFDLLDYKKEDFARRGTKKGIARITFESGLDERSYTVYRDTATGYYVYDNQLKTRIAEKKEEVTRFLWQHLGVEAGTDLESLFRRAIGVPQGTFTAIFLESATERKKAFDKLLKVEEYRQGAEKLRETARYIDNQITAVREKIARAEGELSRLEQVENEHEIYTKQVKEFGVAFETLTVETSEKSEVVKAFDEKESAVNELKTVRDNIQSVSRNAEFVLKQKESERNLASSASEKIKLVESDYKIYVSAVAELKNLEMRRMERDRIRTELNKIENKITSAQAEQKGCGDNLKKVAEARENIARIQPQVAEQEKLEKQRENLRTDLADAKAAENQVTTYEEKLKRLRTNLAEINEQIKSAEQKSAGVENSENLQKRDTEIVQELARLRAVLERDEQFEREVVENLVKNHFCPIVSQKCLNLETGKASETQIGSKNGDGKAQIATLEIEQKTVSSTLAKARDAEKFSAVLQTLIPQKNKTLEEGTHLRKEQETWKSRAENLSKITGELSEIETKLNTLANPKAKLVAYENEIKRESDLKEKLSQTEKNLVRLEDEKTKFNQQLSQFEALDAEWKRLSDERDKTASAHKEFLSNEALAKTLPTRESEFANAKAAVEKLKKDLAQAETDFETASKDYDRERHLTEKAALLEAEKRLAETGANLENAKRFQKQLAAELDRLSETLRAMQNEFREKERLEKLSEATAFIRETLKEAAPRVARNYVHFVSIEANRMFREISGSAERTLKWTEDYGIVLEENGYERPFVNLSGGEQMAAALSVRLAILMQLSDIRLAFFDEPTTNMD